MALQLLAGFLYAIYIKDAENVIRIIQDTKKNPVILNQETQKFVRSMNAVSDEAVTKFNEDDISTFLNVFVDLAPPAFAKSKSNIINVFSLIEQAVEGVSPNPNEVNAIVANLCNIFFRSLANSFALGQFIDIIPEGVAGFMWINDYEKRLKEDITSYADKKMTNMIKQIKVVSYEATEQDCARFNKFIKQCEIQDESKRLLKEINEFQLNSVEQSKNTLQTVATHFSKLDAVWKDVREKTPVYYESGNVDGLKELLKESKDSWEKIVEESKTLL